MDEIRDQAYFNRWASTYEESWMQKYFDRVHDVLLDQVVAPGPAHLLDVGCGSGRLLRKAGARWPAAALTGVDRAERMIEVARRLNPRAAFYVAPADQLPLPAGTVDVVMSSVSLHHWPDPAAGLREAARVLRADGRLVLADMAVPPWLAWLPRAGVRTKTELQELVVGAGFSVTARQSLLAGLVAVVTADKTRAAV